jgi:glycine dehydrogenase subunit 1
MSDSFGLVTAHPYMANSVPEIKREMLDAIGVGSVDELFEQIPREHRLTTPLRLPPALTSELELRSHLLGLLNKNNTCEGNLNFLGAGCWQHFVPGICDEIAARRELVTNIWGTSSSDHGRNQGLFEFCSEIAELVDLDCVGLPVYSWGCAAGYAIRMAARLTGRREVLIPRLMDPERLSVIRTYCEPVENASHLTVRLIDYVTDTGGISLADLEAKISSNTAAVYFETPSYIGAIDANAATIAEIARRHGAQVIVGVDPLSLGVLSAPPQYGADIVVGSIQPLGLHMLAGGSLGGFIASRDEERYVREFPTLLLSAAPTIVPGELGYSMTLLKQSSYDAREQGKDWTGHTVHLWAQVCAAYMALLGPTGFTELGALVLSRSHYAAKRLQELDGIRTLFGTAFFKEFVVNFDGTGMSVAEINEGLRKHGIFGGKDLSAEFPELGQSALYCVTEVHAQADIDRLVNALAKVVSK